jgi:pimeloyl-ACP methyl ester carboxylesterase
MFIGHPAKVPLHAIIDGPKTATPVLLLTGLGQQAIDWPHRLIDFLLAQGYRVFRLDHRDAGLSPLCGDAVIEGLTAADFPDAGELLLPASYRLHDMADDVLHLMDRLHIDRAHVVGYSMGGMIAQILAATSPHRILSLTSLMSSGGQHWIDCAPSARAAMARSICAVADEAECVRRYVEDSQVFAGPSFPIDLDALAIHARIALARSYRPAGTWRQALAIRHGGDRRTLLSMIAAPTLFVHGDADTCISPGQAVEGHALVSGSSMLMIPGAGHDLHPDIVPLLAERLSHHLRDADRVSGLRETNLVSR